MKWFYSKDGQQAGPVDDAELAQLVAQGTIRGDTLVWKEGMPQWQPYSTVAPSPTMPTSGGTATCCVCSQPVTPDNSILIGGKCVCSTCKPSYLQSLHEGTHTESTATGLRYGGFWIRFGALIIDSIILWLVFLPVNLMFGFKVGTGLGGAQPNVNNMEELIAVMGLQFAISIAQMAAGVAYHTFFIYKYQATLGKMLCGLQVIRADGTTPSLGLAFGRALANILSGLTCSIGYIIAAFDDQKRSLHDHICNTRVIYRR